MGGSPQSIHDRHAQTFFGQRLGHEVIKARAIEFAQLAEFAEGFEQAPISGRDRSAGNQLAVADYPSSTTTELRTEGFPEDHCVQKENVTAHCFGVTRHFQRRSWNPVG